MMTVVHGPQEYADRHEPGALAGAAKTIAGVKNSFTVAHMIRGCASMASFLRTGGPIPDGGYSPFVETGLQKGNIIFAGNEALIEQAFQHGMNLLRGKGEISFIITHCATSIIAENLQSVAANLESKHGVPVIPLDTAGFVGGFNRGSELVWDALASRFAVPYDGEREGINLVGPQLMGSKNWPNDIVEIRRLLEAAGVPVNLVMAHNLQVSQVAQIGYARANYVLCGEQFPDFDNRCEALGLERWGQEVVLPLGIHNTEEWYRAVAGAFGDVDRALAQMQADMDRVRRILRTNYNASWALQAASSKHVGLIGYAAFAAALARCLFYDFNMRPQVVALLGETPAALQAAERLLEPMSEYLDFQVLENPSYLEYGKALQEAGVDLSIGMLQDRVLSEGMGIPQIRLGGFYFYNQFNFVPWPNFGILGVLNLLGELWQGLERVLAEPDAWSKLAYRPRDEERPQASPEAELELALADRT